MEYVLDVGLCFMEALAITFALDSRFPRRLEAMFPNSFLLYVSVFA